MHPDLISIAGITLHTYGLLVALGLILASWLAQREATRTLKIPGDTFWDLSLWIILSGMVGARILYVLIGWETYRQDLLGIFKFWDGGLVFYGGFIGGALGGWWYIRKKALPFWKIADIAAPVIPLAHMLGRFGCFFAGCCYGREDAQWGLVFPALGDNVPHLPTQLYEAGFNFVLFGFLWWRRKAPRADGRLFWMYVGLYAAWRFVIEFFRGDEIRGTVLVPWLHTSQVVALAGMAVAVVFWVYLGKRVSRV